MGPPFIIAFIVFPFLPSFSGTSAAPLFGEYIGAEFNGVRFSEVPVDHNVEFHFILSFAIDNSSSGAFPAATGGHFNVFWDTENLRPSDVLAIKSQHPNVRVALSLGGDVVSGALVYFDPSNINTWVSNGVTSLTSIIQQHHLDGIDVNYEHFHLWSDPNIFSRCIWELITTLKNNRVISFASIAPFYAGDVQRNYMAALWRDYGSVIDYVNFQFYAYPSSTMVSQFENYFNEQASNYGGRKVLVSFSSAKNPGGLTPNNGFFAACDDLRRQGKLHGMFAWSADDSKANGFQYERQAQAILAGGGSH